MLCHVCYNKRGKIEALLPYLSGNHYADSMRLNWSQRMEWMKQSAHKPPAFTSERQSGA